MNQNLKIKVSIADRVYPMTVEYSQEEGLRSASKKIDILIRKFEENYALRDKQDALAMCALQFATQVEQRKIDISENYTDAINRLQEMNNKLDIILSK